AATPRCARIAIEEPKPPQPATIDDPCLRRLLATRAIDQIDADDVRALRPELRAIAAIPPPESQLVAATFKAVPEEQPDLRLEFLVAAWNAGQHDLVDASLGGFDEAHLISAARDLHFAGALEQLSAEGFRAVYLHAVTDE